MHAEKLKLDVPGTVPVIPASVQLSVEAMPPVCDSSCRSVTLRSPAGSVR
jgi:hypothetical protein